MSRNIRNNLKLNLGCGKRNFGENWLHIDGGDYGHLHSHDIVKLPFNNESAKLIYASHVIEYFDREELKILLKEWHRVLNKGGTLRLAVPNFQAICRLYADGEPLHSFLGPLFGKMPMSDQIIYHKTVFDYQSLRNVLCDNGFRDVREWDWRKVEHGKFDDHSQAYIPHLDKENGTLISLNIQATKV